MDCPDTCALEVTVTNGKIEKISGSRHQHPNTDGFICSKVSKFARRVYYPERILYPMKRVGKKGSGKYKRMSWAKAIDEIVRKLQKISQKWGGEAIYPYHYGGSNGLLGDEFIDHYFFAKLGTSRCQKTICAAPSTAVATGMYGKMPGVAFEDYPKAKCILIWGANPKASNIHLVPYLKAAKKNGAFIAAIDPNRNFSSDEVDVHLPVYPGADLPLALGMIHHWQAGGKLDQKFLKKHATNSEALLAAAAEWTPQRAAETARIPLEDLIAVADRFAEATPAVLRCGWGTERNRNGGQALAAILAIPALLGKFGVAGGGYTMSNSGGAKINKQNIFGDMPWDTRELNQTRLAEQLNGKLDPPIKALFVYNCNPVATVPDQNGIIRGLHRDDLFIVVSEQVMTDTCHYADIVLPAVTFLEQQEIRKSYGSYVVGGVQPVIQPCGEAIPNEVLFARLGRAMGWHDEPFFRSTTSHIKNVARAMSLNGEKGDADLWSAGRVQRYDFDGQPPVQFKTIFPQTEDKKINLTPEALGEEPYHFEPVEDAQFPLAMISPGNKRMISSTMGEYNYPTLFVTIHPEDAEARGIQIGDSVRVFNQLGEVRCLAKVKDTVRPGVVSMPKGAWRKSSLNQKTSTALCPATVNVVGGGACYNDARVEVEKLPQG